MISLNDGAIETKYCLDECLNGPRKQEIVREL